MRYNLEDGVLKPVVKVTFQNIDFTNPSDAFIDTLGVGYQLREDDPPAYDTAMYDLQPVYTQHEDYIELSWELIPKSKVELIKAIDDEINRINAEYESWKNIPIEYDGKGYLPRWISEVYTPMRTLPAEAFPMTLSAVDFTAKAFTYEEFNALYLYLLNVSAAYIAEVNTQLAVLEAKKQELEA